MPQKKQKNKKEKSKLPESDIVIPGLLDEEPTKTPLREEKPKAPASQKLFKLETKKAETSLFKLQQKRKKPKEKVIKEEKKGKLFSITAPTKQAFVSRLASNLAFFIISIGIFAFSIYFDSFVAISRFPLDEILPLTLLPQGEIVSVIINGQETRVSDSFLLEGSEIVNTQNAQNVQIALSDRSLIRLGSQTELELKNIDENKTVFELNRGKLWVNTLYDNKNVDIFTQNVLVTPSKSALNIEADDTKTKVFANDHNAFVGIYNDDPSNLINQFWLIEGNQVQISHKKIADKAETISKLLYSKLIKEFNYGRLSSKKIAEDMWIASQIKTEEKAEEITEEKLEVKTEEKAEAKAKEKLKVKKSK